MPNIKAIAAVSQNNVIGKKGDLPWRLPGELKWFKKITMGHVIVMGRKTWNSLPNALPGRENWVLSRSNVEGKGIQTFTEFNQIEKQAGNRTVFIIGGGEIYSAFLSYCSELYLTEVQQTIIGGDAFFPSYENDFQCIETLEENKDFILRKWKRKIM
jgi:dihydrofolate reductase